MSKGVISRLRLAATVALASATALIALTATAESNPGDPLLPDLRVQKPAELYLKGSNAKTLRLRFSNTVENLGSGPLELTQDPAGAPPPLSCNPPGKPAGGRETLQSVYEDSAHGPSNGFFLRGSDSVSNRTPIGCSRYHRAHNHWHFDNFARYALYRERTGSLVGRAKKASFCIVDGPVADPSLDGVPGEGYYPRDPAAPDPKFVTCSETSTNGISIGYADTYGAALPGQAIQVTRKRGRFCLALRVDPGSGGAPDGQIEESNPNNNVTGQRLQVMPRQGKVKRLPGPCKTPLPPLDA